VDILEDGPEGPGEGVGPGVPPAEDDRRRCSWSGRDPLARRYHDLEWGRPVGDGVRLFEKLSLEAFQAGLSWSLILRRRDAFRRAFAGFDPERVAGFGPADVERLLADRGIVRNRAKIEAVLHNARRCLELEGGTAGLAALAWSYEGDAAGLSRELKRRGWRFIGPVAVHAFMQSVGMVNDHEPWCFAREECERARATFARPVHHLR